MGQVASLLIAGLLGGLGGRVGVILGCFSSRLLCIIVTSSGIVPGFVNQDTLGRLLGFGGSGKRALGVGRGSLHLVKEFLHGTSSRISHARYGIAGLGHAARNLGNVANHSFDLYEIGGKGVDGGLARLEERLNLSQRGGELIDSASSFATTG